MTLDTLQLAMVAFGGVVATAGLVWWLSTAGATDTWMYGALALCAFGIALSAWTFAFRHLPVWVFLIVGALGSVYMGAMWRLRIRGQDGARARTSPEWRRWRYVVAASAFLVTAAAVTVGLLSGSGIGAATTVALLAAIVSVASDILIWRVLRDRLRPQGWDW